MTKIDQFESVFKSASKVAFSYQTIDIRSVLVVTDLEEAAAGDFGEKARDFLGVIDTAGELSWRNVHGAEFRTVEDLLNIVKEEKPDLICAYRTLHSSAWKWSHSLGVHLDVLTQATTIPVLVFPHPETSATQATGHRQPDSVMAMTDHLTGDQRLVNYALRFTTPKGTLHLTNVEDSRTFERYIDAISKIPSIDTEMAREHILKQLLKEPHDYVGSCEAACLEHGVEVSIEETIVLGEHLREYKRLVEEKAVALLVLNTKDEDQLAMHGLAYPLSVELNHIPLLLL